jgi:hypothetical protein
VFVAVTVLTTIVLTIVILASIVGGAQRGEPD